MNQPIMKRWHYAAPEGLLETGYGFSSFLYTGLKRENNTRKYPLTAAAVAFRIRWHSSFIKNNQKGEQCVLFAAQRGNTTGASA